MQVNTNTNLIRRMLEDMMDDVEEFHRRVVKVQTPAAPRLLSQERQTWSENFLQEELDEFRKAYAEGNLPDAVDALVDTVYVAIGRLLEMGVPPTEAWDPVQRANLAKERGRTHRGVDTDAAKPEGWMPPDHETLMKNLALRSCVSQSLLEATAIKMERGANYNKGTVRREDHFPLGITSTFDAMWLKIIRLRSDIEENPGAPVVNRDHPRDLINYADFMMCQIDKRPL